MRPAIVLVLAAALVLPLSACGDDGGADAPDAVPVDGWAAAVCGGLRPAVGDLEAALATIDELPAEVDPDAPLGDRVDDLEGAFGALPTWTEAYLGALEGTGPPDIADGPAFRDEVLADLREADHTFTDTAMFVERAGPRTTAAQFFNRAQAFAGFSDALAAVDLDFGEDVPLDVADAVAADADCRFISDHLAAALG